MSKRIMIIAGEASGDKHAAEAVKAIHAKDKDILIEGIAGPQMREAGVKALVNAETIAIMGFVEVLKHFRVIIRTYKTIKKALIKNKPDLIILVDYPGFNLKIAQLAKKLNIKVLYYISPQIWAWKKGRITKIKETVDYMAVTFPFEVELYEKAGVPVSYVGSPLLEELPTDLTKEKARGKLNLAQDKRVLGILPGSRQIEINRILPEMLKTAELLYKKDPALQFVLPVASMLSEKDLEKLNTKKLPINFVDDFYSAIVASDAVMSTSGTATLETALLGAPLIIVYKMNPATFQMIKRIIKIDTIGLCNIVAGEKVAEEFIQHQANAKAMASQLDRLLYDEAYHQAICSKLAGLRGKLHTESHASEELAKIVFQFFS